jgi:hypothetical protein
MLELLLTKSVYIGRKNDFFTQLTGISFDSSFAEKPGTPLPDLPLLPNATYSVIGNHHPQIQRPVASTSSRSQKRKYSQSDGIFRKKLKTRDEGDNGRDGLPKAPNAIVFARSRMFYGRPARSLRGKVVFGLRKERTITTLFRINV